MIINHGWKPMDFFDLPDSHRAVVIAAIDKEIENRPKSGE